ncbi:Methyltransferase domain-containing protein [Dysgonomonas macrotermitis]|uniref:Methyltransferase domain-containing protein n=1 Tax=Dysgonomonas macrotermitis TaxID=1346286 RepID=A0A1M5CAF9_9BACT|nr:Methyltransferase domain-containing protein [Dysgonomonas macrotermitis]
MVSKDFFSVYQCPQCGFAFTQDFPAESEIGIYYDAPEYVSHTDSHKGIINTLYHQARKISLRSKVRFVQKCAAVKAGTLLDIGCGTGYFLDAMRHHKWIVTGIEKSEPTRKYAHEKFGLNIQDSEYLFEIPAKTKDTITLWHVLEHLEKLNETMANLHRILKDNGVLFIALPNKKSVDARYYQADWAAYDVPRHLWHFSPDDFEQFAAKHHFELVKIKGMPFDPFYISMLSEKNKGTFAGSLLGLIKGGWFFLRSLFNTRQSSSLIYILKKK